MKNYLAIAILLAFCFACKFGALENTKTSDSSPKSNKDSISQTNQVENHSAKNDSPTKSENPLVSLKKMKDKTASEIKLWSNKEIGPRLEKLMGADYLAMKKFWGVETPLEVEGDVLMLTGCEPHNCGSNQYIIFIDTAGDNINVHHILDESLKSYQEKGEIKLPKKFAESFASDTYGVKNK